MLLHSTALSLAYPFCPADGSVKFCAELKAPSLSVPNSNFDWNKKSLMLESPLIYLGELRRPGDPRSSRHLRMDPSSVGVSLTLHAPVDPTLNHYYRGTVNAYPEILEQNQQSQCSVSVHCHLLLFLLFSSRYLWDYSQRDYVCCSEGIHDLLLLHARHCTKSWGLLDSTCVESTQHLLLGRLFSKNDPDPSQWASHMLCGAL